MKKTRLITIKRTVTVQVPQKDGKVKEEKRQQIFYAKINNDIVPDHHMIVFDHA